jgi:hypothetical protein
MDIVNKIDYEQLKSIVDKYSIDDFVPMSIEVKSHICSKYDLTDGQFWMCQMQVDDIMCALIPKYKESKQKLFSEINELLVNHVTNESCKVIQDMPGLIKEILQATLGINPKDLQAHEDDNDACIHL